MYSSLYFNCHLGYVKQIGGPEYSTLFMIQTTVVRGPALVLRYSSQILLQTLHYRSRCPFVDMLFHVFLSSRAL